jgi:hypothetical protein
MTSGAAATHLALRELNTRLDNPLRLQIIALYCRGNVFFGDFVIPFARLSHQHHQPSSTGHFAAVRVLSQRKKAKLQVAPNGSRRSQKALGFHQLRDS